MLAAAHGHLDIARRLVQAGATVELLGITSSFLLWTIHDSYGCFYWDLLNWWNKHVQTCYKLSDNVFLADKYKRSALTHAVMNGNANVASYLLYLGADPNRVDSSGNSLAHYAAAYGWYFVLKLLVNEGGANPSVANDWQVWTEHLIIFNKQFFFMFLKRFWLYEHFLKCKKHSFLANSCGCSLFKRSHGFGWFSTQDARSWCEFQKWHRYVLGFHLHLHVEIYVDF